MNYKALQLFIFLLILASIWLVIICIALVCGNDLTLALKIVVHVETVAIAYMLTILDD